MPKLDLTLNTRLSEDIVNKVVQELTSLTKQYLGKKPEVTRIHVHQNPGQCFINAVQINHPSVFDLAIYITEGTNTGEQKAQWLCATHQFLSELLGNEVPQYPNYISIIELNTHNWGFNGISQFARSR